MKRVFILLLSVVLIAGCFTGCQEQEPTPPVFTAQPDISDSGEPVEYKVSGALSSNMVLQQNKYIHIWGSSPDKGAYLYGEFMGETRYAQVDDQGQWELIFSAHPYTREPQTMKIYPKNGSVTEFTDILIGDVWAVSGQSNAELHVDVSLAYNPEFVNEISEDDAIRVYYQGLEDVYANQDKCQTPQNDVLNEEYYWQKTTEEVVMKISAIGYYFAKEISKHTEIPIGIVMMAAGGYPLKQFMPADLVSELLLPNGSDIYNTMMYPFAKMPIRGMLFYQGENDNWEPEGYAEYLAAFVKKLRELYGYDFPFYNVQLSSHAGAMVTEWPGLYAIRCEQQEAVSLIENSYLVASYDCGVLSESEPDMAHPYNKKPVGDRLAYLALSEIYDRGSYDIDHWASPIPDSVKWSGNTVTVTFSHVGDGLKVKVGQELRGFYILDQEGNILTKAEAEISGDSKVKVTIPENYEDTCGAIGYACEAVAAPMSNNLVNSNELPAVAFRLYKE